MKFIATICTILLLQLVKADAAGGIVSAVDGGPVVSALGSVPVASTIESSGSDVRRGNDEEYDHGRHYHERPEKSIGGEYAADASRIGGSPISAVAVDGSAGSSGGVASSGDGGIVAATVDTGKGGLDGLVKDL